MLEQLLVQTLRDPVGRQWLFEHQVRHNQRCCFLPGVEVVFNLHHEVGVVHDLLRQVAHLVVGDLVLVEDLLHFAVGRRLQGLKGAETQGHVDL